MAQAEFQPAFEAALKRGIKGFDSITMMNRLSGGASQVYVGAHDGTFYAFGFPIEH